MSRVGSASSNPIEVNSNEAESEPIASPAKKAESSSSELEPWRPHRGLTWDGPAFAEATNNARELEAQMQRETAGRQASMKAIANLQSPLSQLAKKFPDPFTSLGNIELKSNQLAAGPFGDAIHSGEFELAASTLSSADFREAVAQQVKKAWPQCPPQKLGELNQYFMRQMNESLRERAAPRLQSLATKMLDVAAKSFDKAAADPSAVNELVRRLNEMAEPTAESGDRAAVRDLRAGLGLDPDKTTVTAQDVAAAMKERAQLLHQEMTKMKFHDRPSLFRALSEQDVGPLFKKAAGVREGSLLAAQIDAVKTEGESEKETIAVAKFSSLFLAAAFTGGMALGASAGGAAGTAAMGMSVSGSMSAPGVLLAWQEVDTAKAGESAGTMRQGAGEDAKRRAVLETGAAVIGAVAGAGANQALHPLMHGANAFVTGVAHGAVEVAADYTAEKAAEGLNAVER